MMGKPTATKTWFVVSSLIFCVLSAFLYFQCQKNTHSDIDSKAYIQRAQLWSTTGSFKVHPAEQQPYYALGYSMIISMLWRVFSQSLAIIILFQILLALLSFFLMLRIVQMLYGPPAVPAAALLFCCSVGYLVFAQFILTEVVLSFFLVLFMYFFIKWIKLARPKCLKETTKSTLYVSKDNVVPAKAGIQENFRLELKNNNQFFLMLKNIFRGYELEVLPGSRLGGRDDATAVATSSSSEGASNPTPFAPTCSAKPLGEAWMERAQRVGRGVRTPWLLVKAALTLGLSILIKPAALYFIWPLCLFIIYVSTGRWFIRMSKALFFVICFYLPIVAYMGYNAHEFGSFSSGSLDKVNLYYWFFPNVLANLNNTTSDIERVKLLALSGGQHDFSCAGPIFWQTLQQHPFVFVKVWMVNVLKTFLGLYTTNLKVLVQPSVHGGDISFFKMKGGLFSKLKQYVTVGATQSWIVVVGIFEALLLLLRYVLVLAGLGLLLQRKQYDLLLLCLGFLGYFALITGHDGCARFRMMIEFLLIILAAGGWVFFIRLFCLKREKGL